VPNTKTSTHRDPYCEQPDKHVFERIRQVYQDQQARRTTHEELRKLITQEYELSFPKSVEPTVIKMGTGPAVVNRLDGYFTTRPRFNVLADGEGVTAMSKATKIEQWLNAALVQMVQDAGIDVWDLMKRDVLSLGLGGTQLSWDSSAWDGIPDRYLPQEEHSLDEQKHYGKERDAEIDEYKQRGARFPIVWRWVSGYSSDYIRDLNGLAEVFDIDFQDIKSVVSRYPDSKFAKAWWKRDPSERVQSKTVPVCHYANRTYCAVMLLPNVESPGSAPTPNTEEPEAEFLTKPYPHLLTKDVNYSICEGIQTGIKEVGQDVVGPLFDVRKQIVMADSLRSQVATAERQLVYLSVLWKHSNPNPEVDEDGNPKPYAWEEGTIWHLYDGDDIQILEAKRSPALQDTIADLDQGIARSTMPSVNYGQGAGVSSGYMANSLQEAGTLHFDPIEKHLKQSLERTGLLMLQLVQAAGQTVWVRNRADGGRGYLGLSLDDIGPYLPELEATVREKPPQDLPADMRVAMDAVNSGMWDIFTARDYVPPRNGKNPEEIEAAIQAYQLMTSQPIQQELVARVMANIEQGFLTRQQQEAPQSGQVAQMTPQGQQAGAMLAMQATANGQGLPPELYSAMTQPPVPQGPPVPGAPNLNMDQSGATQPAPPPTSGIATGQASQGGRPAGSRRRPSGPQQQGGQY
jgi:hypothetical protein